MTMTQEHSLFTISFLIYEVWFLSFSFALPVNNLDSIVKEWEILVFDRNMDAFFDLVISLRQQGLLILRLQ